MKALEKLVAALSDAGAPKRMIRTAREGYYDEVWSTREEPIHDLVRDARRYGLREITERALLGHFAATEHDVQEWHQWFDSTASDTELHLLNELTEIVSQLPRSEAKKVVERRIADIRRDHGAR